MKEIPQINSQDWNAGYLGLARYFVNTLSTTSS